MCTQYIRRGLFKIYQKLTQERFIQLCYEVRGLQVSNINSLNSLDKDIDDDEPEMIKNTWIPADGITPKMLFEICKILHISHYAFDATNKCFLKYVSENNHSYPALTYYAVNDHLYHIKDINALKKILNHSKPNTELSHLFLLMQKMKR